MRWQDFSFWLGEGIRLKGISWERGRCEPSQSRERLGGWVMTPTVKRGKGEWKGQEGDGNDLEMNRQLIVGTDPIFKVGFSKKRREWGRGCRGERGIGANGRRRYGQQELVLDGNRAGSLIIWRWI